MMNKRGVYTQIVKFFEDHSKEATSQVISKLLIKLMQNYDSKRDPQVIANLMNIISAHLYEDYNNISQDINHHIGIERLEFQSILHNEFLPN